MNDGSTTPDTAPESGWTYVGLGLAGAVIGAVLIVTGTDEREVLGYFGMVLAAGSSVLTLIGCVAVGVSTGMRHANHDS